MTKQDRINKAVWHILRQLVFLVASRFVLYGSPAFKDLTKHLDDLTSLIYEEETDDQSSIVSTVGS